MSEEIFRGHLDECVKHLSERVIQRWPEGGKGAAKAKKPMAVFCGVGVKTVADWLRPPFRTPNGETYFKFICYLDLMGYRVIELENTPKTHRNFLELIGYGLLTGAEASRTVGYSEPSDCYRALRGTNGISSKKEEVMWALWKEKKNQLAEKKVASTDLRIALHQETAFAAETPIVPAKGKQAVLSIMDGLVELLDGGALNQLTNEEIAGSERTIVRLTAHMNRINSRIVLSNEGGDS